MKEDIIFAPAFGRRPAMLLGREQVTEEFLQGLTGVPGSRDRATLIMGQRGSGKTVLLLEMAEIAKKNGFIAASPTVVDTGMLDQIIEKLQYEGTSVFRQKKKQLSGVEIGFPWISASLSFTGEDQEGRSFSYKLHRLCEALEKKNKGVLILVDEVQANHAELRRLAITYQELVGAGRNVALAMAGLPGAVSGTLNDKVLTFLHRARKIRLQELAVGEIDAFYADAFSRLGISVSDEQRERAAASAKGSPYYMQLIGHYIAKYSGSDGKITNLQLAHALQKATAEYKDGVCIAVADSLTDLERDFIASMNRGNTGISEIIRRMEIKPDLANNYRRRLLDAGILESPKRGQLICTVPELVEYLKERS